MWWFLVVLQLSSVLCWSPQQVPLPVATTDNNIEYVISEAKINELKSKGVNVGIYEKRRWQPRSANITRLMHVQFLPEDPEQQAAAPHADQPAEHDVNLNQAASQPIVKKYGLVWLHGLRPSTINHDGGQAMDLQLGQEWAIRRPTASEGACPFFQGETALSWFQIKVADAPLQTCLDCPASINAAMAQFVEPEIASLKAEGIPEENILVAGFSQGGSLAIHTVLHTQYKIKGGLAWGSYMSDTSEPKRSSERVLHLLHGVHDDIIPVDWAKEAHEEISKPRYKTKVALHQFESDGMGHVESLEVAEIQEKAREVLNAIVKS